MDHFLFTLLYNHNPTSIFPTPLFLSIAATPLQHPFSPFSPHRAVILTYSTCHAFNLASIPSIFIVLQVLNPFSLTLSPSSSPKLPPTSPKIHLSSSPPLYFILAAAFSFHFASFRCDVVISAQPPIHSSSFSTTLSSSICTLTAPLTSFSSLMIHSFLVLFHSLF